MEGIGGAMRDADADAADAATGDDVDAPGGGCTTEESRVPLRLPLALAVELPLDMAVVDMIEGRNALACG